MEYISRTLRRFRSPLSFRSLTAHSLLIRLSQKNTIFVECLRSLQLQLDHKLGLRDYLIKPVCVCVCVCVVWVCHSGSLHSG
jgi:hypothetical protein